MTYKQRNSPTYLPSIMLQLLTRSPTRPVVILLGHTTRERVVCSLTPGPSAARHTGPHDDRAEPCWVRAMTPSAHADHFSRRGRGQQIQFLVVRHRGASVLAHIGALGDQQRYSTLMEARVPGRREVSIPTQPSLAHPAPHPSTTASQSISSS
jgi:hypothetical protein